MTRLAAADLAFARKILQTEADAILAVKDRLNDRFDLAIRILVETRRVPGIDMTEMTPDLGNCPVCGHDVAMERTKCTACRTPHHEDCWQYSGGCAIFGCSGRRVT